MFHKMPLILLLAIAAILLVDPFLSLQTKEIFYAISLTIKSGIVLLLPFIIFGLLFDTMVGLARRATAVIALILVCVICSNTLSTFISHFVGSWVYHFNLAVILPTDSRSLNPAWTWQFPKLIANDKAMFLAIGLGILWGALHVKSALKLAVKLEWAVSRLLTGFIYIIPFFVIGFVVKLHYDGVIQTIIKDYTVIFAWIACAQFSYIFLAYLTINRFRLQRALSCIKNILPAAIAGFTTMSSAAVMPLTIAGAENNAKNKELAGSVIPATVNIHLIGDCFAIPILAYAVMKSYGYAEPSLISYLIFLFYFVIAKFSVAAIPGGGIIVMLPILESCLGFNSDMLSLITALYILFDPVITCANILGNGAFAQLIDNMMAFRTRERHDKI